MELKLVKVVVQAHFIVLDGDGQVESELVAEPMTVTGKEWPRFAESEFREAQRALAEEVERGVIPAHRSSSRTGEDEGGGHERT